MVRKLQAMAILMLMSSYAVAGTVSIGTVSSRGDIRVDSYLVKGNATIFDGSVIETGQDGADLRLPGTDITMSQDSRAILYRDRIVLEQGKTEFTSSGSFNLQANGLHMTPTTRDARWFVSLKSGNDVEVAALTGEVGVTNDHGVLLASILPGRALSFASQPGGSSEQFSATGSLSRCDGHLILTVDATGLKYEVEVTGAKMHKLGKNVTVDGKIDPNKMPACGATAVVVSDTWPVAVGASGLSSGTTTALIIGGIAVAAVATFVGLTVGASAPSTVSQ